MKTYPLPGVRAEIIRPRVPLWTWLSQQEKKPYALVNASLYENRDGVTLPCGTVIEGGKIKVNSGNGFGFGTVVNGSWGFGTPWECAWQEYLTGYTGLVQGGQYVAPAFRDSYVFDCRLNRIGLGEINGELAVCVSDGVDIYTFGRQAQQAGFRSFINLDGGGSRYLHIDGKTVYTSSRTPYNAIAFYKDEEEKPVSDSGLIAYTKLSPNCAVRTHAIDTITIHHTAGVASVEALGNLFASASRQASANYGIGNDGRIALFVPESKRAMTSSNTNNDNRAVTIEVSNSVAAYPWRVSDAAYKSLIKLCADICKRNGIDKLVWRSTKSERVSHLNGANMTVHRDFAATQCPGDYLMGKMFEIAAEVNAMLVPIDTKPDGYDNWLKCYEWYRAHE